MTTKSVRRLDKVQPSIVYRLFNPQVPVILCSKYGYDVAAMPSNSCSSASESPPMVSVAIKNKLRTDRILRKSSWFSINWMSFQPKRSRRIILELATPFSSMKSKDKLELHRVPYNLIQNVPVLEDAYAFALCKVKKRIRTGDHDLFIASVIFARASTDFTVDGYWRFKDYKPILYLGSIRSDPLTTI